MAVYSFGGVSGENRKFWHRVLQDGDIHNGDLDEAISLLHKHGAIEDTVERARHYGAMAHDALAIFPETNYKSALLDTVAFCIDRAH